MNYLPPQGLATGMWRGSLGASFASTDWQVRVFWLSSIVDRPSDCLYVRTITLSGCMDIRSCYIPFLIKHDYQFGRTPIGVRITWINTPLRQPPPETTRALNFFRLLRWLGLPPDQNCILQELVGLQLMCTFNIGHPISSYTIF